MHLFIYSYTVYHPFLIGGRQLCAYFMNAPIFIVCADMQTEEDNIYCNNSKIIIFLANSEKIMTVCKFYDTW